MSYSETKLLYIAIYVLTTLFSFLSQQEGKKGGIVFKKFWLLCSFLIHWSFLSFTNIGADYDHYIRNIENTSASDLVGGVEIGFNGLCYIIYSICHSADITIFIIKTIEVVILYFCFYKLRFKCNIALSVFAYNALIFLQSILLLSMHFGIVLLFLSFVYMLQRKWAIACIVFLLSCSVHSSSLLLAPCYLLIYLFNKFRQKINLFLIFIGLLVAVYAVQRLEVIFKIAMSNIVFFQQYSNYALISNYSGSGIMQIVFFIPIFYFLLMVYFSNLNFEFTNALIVFSIVAFIYAILGYKMEVFSRINMNFIGIYSAFIPAILFSQKYKYLKYSIKVPYLFNWCFWIVYLLMRAYLVFNSSLDLSSETDIYKYNFFNPF